MHYEENEDTGTLHLREGVKKRLDRPLKIGVTVAPILASIHRVFRGYAVFFWYRLLRFLTATVPPTLRFIAEPSVVCMHRSSCYGLQPG
jgi:hypothetical protein